MTTTAAPQPLGTPEPDLKPIKAKRRPGDLAFSSAAVGSGILILLTLAAVAGFLIVQAAPALFATGDQASILSRAGNFWAYVGPLVFGTIWAAALALVIATPISIGIALFISHYAPRRLAAVLGYAVDLLAAVPSIVFGLWGILVLSPAAMPIYAWINDLFWWIPIFGGNVTTGRTILTAVLVLAVMILPIMTAICREVFLQTPKLHEEAALALGATRWEMIKMSVLPFARSGIVSAGVLGLGRALGETMAVALVLSATPGLISFELLTAINPATIAANIAWQFPDSYGLNINVLIGTGLVLFVVTFAVNAFARWIVNRRKEFSGAN